MPAPARPVRGMKSIRTLGGKAHSAAASRKAGPRLSTLESGKARRRQDRDDLVRELQRLGVNSYRPTIRTRIAIRRVLAHCGGHAHPAASPATPSDVEPQVMARACGNAASAAAKPKKRQARD